MGRVKLKKKIVGVIISIIALYFLSSSYYDKLSIELASKAIGIYYSSKIPEGNEKLSVEVKDFNGNDIVGEWKKEQIGITLHALSAALIDGDNGRVLYEKSGDKIVPMASTTKIMTCIIALENGNLDDLVTVSKYASTMPDVQLNIMAGEKYRLKDLLYSLMLESHNDVSVAIAEHIGGSVEGFAAMMNAKAKELGCENTSFVTPNGLDADGHHTTAVELARIASYAIKNPDFIAITNTPAYQITEVSKGKVFSLTNKDRFLTMYDGAIGVKTGFTNKAGYCFVGAVKKDNKTFITAVLGSGWPPNKNYKWRDTTLLMNYGTNNYQLNQIFNKDKVFEPITVFGGRDKQVGLYYEGDLSLLMKKDEVVKIIYELPRYLVAPISSHTTIGSAKYYINDTFFYEVPIKTLAGVEKIDFWYCLQKLSDIILFRSLPN